ncbi:spheroidene monooxygenase [Ferruginibacter lapsinanis]|uniref:spheroidene monooxygenase n=1 Tax=Ferruginibacter lapsinanis TaxID=563172 RepID=UPI001E2EFEB8|nr:spheroidene monooxygenase [Ferruginibacter lapsinanis]UEG48752.1 spheroidene monooxygenase [Ferruginibacter lapsinanis]
MFVTLTIQKYPKKYTYFALLSMAIFRLPLLLNKNISFYKLMGCGKNGSFDIHPDWQQWVILSVYKDASDLEKLDSTNAVKKLYGSFIANWHHTFKVETNTILLTPIEGHGKWDGKDPFGVPNKNSDHTGEIAVLTRATIRLSKLRSFWKNVQPVAAKSLQAEGLIRSIGIGEIPLIKQATFSIWKDKEAMKQFAYTMKEHTTVIAKTRKENWYSEEMFVRFAIIKTINA